MVLETSFTYIFGGIKEARSRPFGGIISQWVGGGAKRLRTRPRCQYTPVMREMKTTNWPTRWFGNWNHMGILMHSINRSVSCPRCDHAFVLTNHWFTKKLFLLLVCPKTNVQMTTCFETWIAYHPLDVNCSLLLQWDFRCPIIRFNDLCSLNVDNKSYYRGKCFLINR